MDRSNSERRSSIVSELLLRAAEGMPEANRHEPFARLLTTILQNVGSDIRVVLEMKEGEEGPTCGHLNRNVRQQLIPKSLLCLEF